MPGPDLDFRFATTDDTVALADLIERAYRGPDATQGWTTETHLLTGPRTRTAEIERLIADPGSRFVLAETRPQRTLVGSALVQRTDDSAYFGMFAVDPRRQTLGIGKAVLTACEDAARALWGSQTMTMSVISLRADLIDWYLRRGYRRTGSSEPFPFHEASGALRDDFELTHLSKAL